MTFTWTDPAEILTTSIPDGVLLFDRTDVEILKSEMDNTTDYTLLYEEPDCKMWYKSRGEGSGTSQATNSSDRGSDNPDSDSDRTMRNSEAAANSSFIRYKYYCDFEGCSLQEFYDAMRDYSKRFEWDTRDAGRRIIQIFHTPNHDDILEYQVVEHMVKKGTFVVSDRDFVTLNAEIWEDDHTMYCVGKSIEYEGAPQSARGVVRSIILYLGTRIQLLTDGGESGKSTVRVWFVTQTDPKGWIPSSVVNWAQRFLPKEYKQNVERAIAQRRQKSDSELKYTNYYQVANKKQV